MNKLLFLLSCCLLLLNRNAHAATQINTPTVNGTWTLEGSPYYIHNDITVAYGNLLTIQPGVQIIFMGNHRLDVQGQISAVGTMEQKIVFKANDTTSWSNMTLPTAGGWKGIALANGISTHLGTPTFEYCIFKDIKNIQSYGGIASYAPTLYINQCEFFHNITDGHFINLYYNIQNGNSKLKFTNCDVHDNRTGIVMFTLYCDSTYILNNRFYNNTASSGFGVYTHASLNDMSTDYLLFKDNEVYNNTAHFTGGVINCLQGGKVHMHHNQTAFNGAISIQSKTALVDQNLIVNNSQNLTEGIFCGINDGGGGLQLLGQVLDADVAGKNEFIVRNNIIANNYSSISGAGIWAQHCKATIINNTIVNNTVKDYSGSAAIHGWGTYCRLKISNNIILNNKQNYNPSDTGYNNFRYWGPEMSFSKNLLDYYPTNITAGVQGLNTNIYGSDAHFTAVPTGVGPAVNAVSADFSLTAAAADCINKGSMTINTYGSTDYYGHNRVFEQLIDIGAVEYQKTTADTSTGLNHTAAEQYFKLYPNPSTGVLYLEYDAQQHKLLQADIFSLNGQRILEVSLNSTGAIDVSAIAEGIYMLRLVTEQQEIAYKKFVLKK